METSFIRKYFGIRLGGRFREKIFFRVSHPAFHTLVFLGLSLFFFVYAYLHTNMSGLHILFYFLVGVVLLNISDYSIHRFEHFLATKRRLRDIAEFHMVHHQNPNDVYFMQIPPVISLFLSGVVFLFLYLVIQDMAVAMLISAGYNFFYIFYEWMHYGAHCFKPKSLWLKKLQQHHLAHHYKNPNGYFGTTNRLLDRLLKT